MKNNKGEVSEQKQKNLKRVKFTPNRYAYATKFKNYLELKGVKLNTAQKILEANKIKISPETFKTFLSGKRHQRYRHYQKLHPTSFRAQGKTR